MQFLVGGMFQVYICVIPLSTTILSSSLKKKTTNKQYILTLNGEIKAC